MLIFNVDFTMIPLHITKEQKRSVWIMSMGTFLEYFDFKTYLQLAVVIQPLFFPEGTGCIASLATAASFGAAYVFRPVGALLFGWIGDTYGRRVNIIITTLLMALASFVLGCLPTYASIGIAAPIIVMLMRALQGMASGAEQTGAKVYLTESIPAPQSYFFASLIGWITFLGSWVAILACAIMMRIFPEYGWRLMFFLGALIAFVGTFARQHIKESLDFSVIAPEGKIRKRTLFSLNTLRENTRNMLAIFLIELAFPVYSFVSYISLGQLLKTRFHYTNTDLIDHNFLLSFILMALVFAACYTARFIHPLKLMKRIAYPLAALCLFLPYVPLNSPIHVLIVQSLFIDASTVMSALFARSFPTFGRYTYMGFAQSMARVIGALTILLPCFTHCALNLHSISYVLLAMAVCYIVGLHMFRMNEDDEKLAALWSLPNHNA